MTPEQKVKWLILAKAAEQSESEPPPYPCEDLEDRYEELEDGWYDAADEVRPGEVETKIKCEWSRYFEAKSVAARLPDGSWVGWTFWYGGGKHAEPSEVEWIPYAYDLDCVEEEKLVVVRTFSKKADAGEGS